jgi:hypothetical protein
MSVLNVVVLVLALVCFIGATLSYSPRGLKLTPLGLALYLLHLLVGFVPKVP